AQAVEVTGEGGGPVEMTIPPGTVAGRKLRLGKRGLPAGSGAQGDLYAVVHIAVPKTLNARERELFSQLAAASSFNPRAQLNAGARP
ncbi:MAG: DnaJ C-terminal domain-containing protein, partial [Pollutimonas bauzanensis]